MKSLKPPMESKTPVESPLKAVKLRGRVLRANGTGWPETAGQEGGVRLVRELKAGPRVRTSSLPGRLVEGARDAGRVIDWPGAAAMSSGRRSLWRRLAEFVTRRLVR